MYWVSTIPSWVLLIAYAVGLLLSGIIYGLTLESRGKPWGKYMVPVVFFGGLALLRTDIFPIAQRLLWTDFDSANFLAAADPIYGYIRENFPEEFNNTLPSVTGLLRQGKPIREGDLFAPISAVRAKYGSNIRLAGDTELLEYVSKTRQLFLRVLEIEGPEQCNRVLLNGTGILASDASFENYQEIFAEVMLSELKVYGSIARSPRDRLSATSADWGAVEAAAVPLGASTDTFLSVSRMYPLDPSLCASYILMLDAINVTPAPAGPAIAAEIVAATLSP